jgi:hypothetical protein
MKPISLYVQDPAYADFKALSERDGRPIAELIRQAMVEYLERERRTARSVLDLAPHPSGALLLPWSREEIFEEMSKR